MADWISVKDELPEKNGRYLCRYEQEVYGEVCRCTDCYEIKNKGLQAMLVKAFDGVRHLYGKAFRVWSARPTDEQRKAVEWD